MNDIDISSSFASEDLAQVEVVFSGAIKRNGVLKSISKETVFIQLDKTPPEEKKCFVRAYVMGREIYSRGEVVRCKNNGVFVTLENWFNLLKVLSEQAILSQHGVLKSILKAQSVRPQLEASKKEYDAKRKKNCWEVIKCGRESICSAATAEQYDGVFGGTNGGRFCTFVSGTSCKDGIPRPDKEKLKLCKECSFFAQIIEDEFNIRIRDK